MTDISNRYYIGNKARKIGDYFIGFLLIPVVLYFLYGLLMTVSRGILEKQYTSHYYNGYQFISSQSDNYYAIQGSVDIVILLIIVALVIGAFFLFKKRRYIRVGLLSGLVLVLALPGACFAGLYGGAAIGSANAPAGDHYAGLNAGLGAAMIIVIFAGLPASIIIIRKIIKKANSTEKMIEEIAATDNGVDSKAVQNSVVENTNEQLINQSEVKDETTDSNS